MASGKKICHTFTKMYHTFTKMFADEMKESTGMKQTCLTLNQMIAEPFSNDFLGSSRFLKRELAIRFANRIIDMEDLPYGLSSNPNVLQVRDQYVNNFFQIKKFPEIKNEEDAWEFHEILNMINFRLNEVNVVIAVGVKQVIRRLNQQLSDDDPHFREIYKFLDRFYMSRIGLHMLMGKQNALRHPDRLPNTFVDIDTKMSPFKMTKIVLLNAKQRLYDKGLSTPKIDISGDPNFRFIYVPLHLQYILSELLMNSIRAVKERSEAFVCSGRIGTVAPPISITITYGLKDITFKISDKAGGIPRSDLDNLFTYQHNTREDDRFTDRTYASALGCYGPGIPMSRLYARYFGGDLTIVSMENYGTNAYLRLLLSGDKEEACLDDRSLY